MEYYAFQILIFFIKFFKIRTTEEIYQQQFSQNIKDKNINEIEKFIETSNWKENKILENFEQQYKYISYALLLRKTRKNITQW